MGEDTLIGPEHETGRQFQGEHLMEAGRGLVEGFKPEPDPEGVGGYVKVDLIVEGFGNPRDGHYYPRELLEREVQKFIGAQMYVNHLSKAAQEALDGLPRDVQELMGRIHEAEIVTLSEGDLSGRAALRAKVGVGQPWLWNLIRHDAGALGVSLNANGNSRMGEAEGRPAKIVEAIDVVDSVDWVTKAGAGGKVVELMEAQVREQKAERAEQGEALQEAGCDHAGAKGKAYCPDCGAKMREADAATAEVETPEGAAEPEPETPETPEKPEGAAEPEPDEGAAEPAEPEGAEPAAAQPTGEPPPDPEAAVESALESVDPDADEDEFREQLAEAIEERALELANSKIEEAVRVALATAREQFEEQLEEALAEQEAAHSEQMAIVEHRGIAARLIDADEVLKDASKARLKEEFYDRVFEEDGDKDPETVCREAVSAAITKKREEVAEFAESQPNDESAETVESADAGGQMQEGARAPSPSGSRKVPSQAPADKELDRRIGLGDPAPERVAG